MTSKTDDKMHSSSTIRETGYKKQKYSLLHLNIAPVEELIFSLGIVAAFVLLRLRYEDINGNPVPVVVFKNKPRRFHAFLVSLNFGFTAAIMTMSFRAKSPAVARFCRSFAVVCIAFAAGILSWSLLASYLTVDMADVIYRSIFGGEGCLGISHATR